MIWNLAERYYGNDNLLLRNELTEYCKYMLTSIPVADA